MLQGSHWRARLRGVAAAICSVGRGIGQTLYYATLREQVVVDHQNLFVTAGFRENDQTGLYFAAEKLVGYRACLLYTSDAADEFCHV